MALEFSRGQPVRKWEAELWAAWSLCSDLWESLWGPPQPPHPRGSSPASSLTSVGVKLLSLDSPPTPSSAVATSGQLQRLEGMGEVGR